jgi:hypothetical protein
MHDNEGDEWNAPRSCAAQGRGTSLLESSPCYAGHTLFLGPQAGRGLTTVIVRNTRKTVSKAPNSRAQRQELELFFV